jgi:hypothetical protein
MQYTETNLINIRQYLKIEGKIAAIELMIVMLRYIVPSPLAQALYLTRQHYRRTVPSGVDNNRIILLGFFLIMLWSVSLQRIRTTYLDKEIQLY